MKCPHCCYLYTKQINICFCVQSTHVNVLHTHFSILFYYLLYFSPHHVTNNIFSGSHTGCLAASLQTPLGDSVINTEMKKPINQFWKDLKSVKCKSTLMDNKQPDIILHSNSIVCWIPQRTYLIVS
jgi:hypothetical protein